MDSEKQALELSGIESFNPMQLAALKKNWLSKSLVVSAPTASGKTLLAEIASIDSIANRQQKAIYTGPLRALAAEHFSEFKKKYSKELKIRAALSTGDLDGSSSHLKNYDMIFTTFEKLDSLLRHQAEWLASVGLLVIDEVHSLGSDRGPTIEVAVAKLRMLNPQLRVLALSATIPNAHELADWLGAELLESDYRPVPLKEGIFFNGVVHYASGQIESFDLKEPIKALVKDTVFAKGKQALVFANTRKNAEGIALKLAPFVEKALQEKEKKELKKESNSLLNILEQPTEQCRKLSSLVASGVAFHHAGLLSGQRTLIEDAFRSNKIKLIAATPTLCVVPETMVWAGVKEMRADSLGLNKKLLALKGNKLVGVRPEAVIKHENTRDIVNIKSLSGFSVKLTENHRVLLKRNGRKVLLNAGECRRGDRIATVGNLCKGRSRNFNIGHFTIGFPGSTLPMTEDLFYFIGAMLGDGYSGIESKAGNFVFKGSPCLVGRDKEIFLVAKKACAFYGIPCRETKNSYGVPCLVFSKKKWFRVFLANCGVQKGAAKFIAKELMLAPEASIRALAQGLFDTDGYVTRRKEIGFSNISFSLIKDLQRILLLLGVVSRLRERKQAEMKMLGKSYKTKKYFELLISQRKSILNFKERAGFKVKRKSKALGELAEPIESNIHFVSCKRCNYKLFSDLFSGRSEQHKAWGKRKWLIIKTLGNNGRLSSSDLSKKLGFLPYKNEKRLNHHFELIQRLRVGNSKTWELNAIGKLVHKELFQNSKKLETLLKLEECPLCGKKLSKKLRGNWRQTDFEGDLFWDFVSNVSKEKKEKYPFVFDVALPSNDSNSHLFVADGFLVHNSAGVNLPSHTVIIPSLYRYTAGGMARIPVSEFKQQVGRAGRPKYDKEGRGIVVARSEAEKDELFEEYINGKVEPVESRLGVEPVLRMHVLALVASGFVFDLASMDDFFKKTLYARQFSNMQALFEKLQSVLQQLEEMGFIQTDEKRISATPLGQRVSELYLDPQSAFEMISAMKASAKFTPFSYLFILCNCSEMMPWLSVPKAKEPELWEQLQLSRLQMPIDLDREMYFDLNLLKKFNTAEMLEKWIDESFEQSIMDDFKTQPGILHAKLSICDWLCYSSLEIAKLLSLENHFLPLSRLRKRLKYGVREELLPLTDVRHIGRVRARKLWRSNIRSVAELKNADLKDLGRILGPAVAEKAKSALGQT